MAEEDDLLVGGEVVVIIPLFELDQQPLGVPFREVAHVRKADPLFHVLRKAGERQQMPLGSVDIVTHLSEPPDHMKGRRLEQTGDEYLLPPIGTIHLRAQDVTPSFIEIHSPFQMARQGRRIRAPEASVKGG